MSNTPVFYVAIRTRAVTAEIRLNDAPIFEVRAEAAQVAYPTISEWVIAGENELAVDVRELGEGARLHVALCEGRMGDVPEPGAELERITIDWPALPLPGAEPSEPPAELPSPALPLALRELGVVGHPWPAWAWQRAPEFVNDRRTIADLTAYVRDLHGALAAGRVDLLIAHSAIKFNEVAPLYDMSVAEAQQRLTASWAEFMAQPGWRLAPFDENDLNLRLRCDSRLIEPTTLAGAPILRQERAIGGELWSLPIFIGRTNWEYTAGQLTVMR